jgi:hypothetical protein
MLEALVAAPLVFLASQAQAREDWVSIGTVSGHTISIAMNDIPEGTDGIVYFEDTADGGDSYANHAVDCQRRVIYLLGGSDSNIPDWRDKGIAVPPDSLGEAELQIVCPKAGSGPLPGHWVEIGFGESIDKDTIIRGSDALLHFTTYDHRYASADAADCQKRLMYFGENLPGEHTGLPVGPGTFAEAELNFACANAP